MRNFYHAHKQKGQAVPSILGMTASPSNSSVEDFEHLELTLDARCVTPTIHRSELIKHVKKPEISKVEFTYSDPEPTDSMASLENAYHGLNILEDPYLLELKENPTRRNLEHIEKAIQKHSTFSQDQFKGLVRRCYEINRQLGPWTADAYVSKSITNCLTKFDQGDALFEEWLTAEKRYLGEALRNVALKTRSDTPPGLEEISPKAGLLIQELLTVKSPVGIIFAKERTTVAMLYELLSSIPALREVFRMGAIVGASSNLQKRGTIYGLPMQSSSMVMQDFRSGKINLLIATDVLEEGIDVPACNLVICFDRMQTLRSFIQRRGRARMRDSKLIIFLEKDTEAVSQWEAMEKDVRRQYENKDRERKVLEDVEMSEENSSSLCLTSKTTTARIDFNDAKSHLEHFCRVLSKGDFVDARPDFIVHNHVDADGRTTLSATVQLPSFLPSDVRQAESQYQWKTESNATKDAAFQAYVQLYRAGLLNENLLPFTSQDLPGDIEGRASTAEIGAPYRPWDHVAELWRTSSTRWVNSITIFDHSGKEAGVYDVTLPVELHQLRPVTFYLDPKRTWTGVWGTGRCVSLEEAAAMPDHTSTLLSLHFGHRWPVEQKEHIVRFTSRDTGLDVNQISSLPCDAAHEQQLMTGKYLVRNKAKQPFLIRGVLPSKPDAEQVQSLDDEWETFPNDEPYLVVKKWTKRADILHVAPPETSQEALSSKLYPSVLPASWASMDAMPAQHAQFGMLIPSLIHELGIGLKVKHLNETLLKPLNITNLGLVREAISSRSALEPLQYERLEFLGDCILKFCASVLAIAVSEYTYPYTFIPTHTPNNDR